MKRRLVLASALLSGLALPAAAETTEILVHYPMPAFFKSVMDQISGEYMRLHPEVKISFTSPSPTYEDGLQLMLRQAGTDAPAGAGHDGDRSVEGGGAKRPLSRLRQSTVETKTFLTSL